MNNNNDKTNPQEGHPSFILEHVPDKESIKYSIGPYQVLGDIGKGGMGEVLLAYDTVCGRRIALKKIRADLLSHKQMHRRFLKEARITSQLTHPAIIPIYTIQDENNVVYYTMPYVQGETLKKIIRTTAEQEKKESPFTTLEAPFLRLSAFSFMSAKRLHMLILKVFYIAI